MNRLCFGHLNHNQLINDEQEDAIVDYLESNGVEIELDMEVDEMCQMVLSIHPYIPAPYQEVTSNVTDYGAVGIEPYMQIAMIADRDTLNSMIRVSSVHNSKFNEKFFKEYLLKHYPLTLRFKPFRLSYHDYYLKLVYSIHKLYEDYNFPYFSSPGLDPVNILDTVVTFERNQLPLYMLESHLANTGFVNAAKMGDKDLIRDFFERGGERIKIVAGLNAAVDQGTKDFIIGLT